MIASSRADISFNKTPMKNPSDKKSSIAKSSLSDEQLYLLCKRFGRKALLARRKFIGLLPEIFRRKIYLKKHFTSIYEFAAKLGGVSKEQVDTVLHLDRKFEKLPTLKNALNEGEVSMNKLARVVFIANDENEKEIYEKTKVLPSRALEVFVKDIKNENEKQNGGSKPLFDQNLHVQELKLDEDVKQELTEMQEKGIDINEFLRNILKKRREEIEKEKARITAQQNTHDQTSTGVSNSPNNKPLSKPSRYIPIQIQRLLHKEHGTLCSVPHCQKPATIIHHTLPFSISHSHDPHFLAPLCENHHKIAHLNNIKFAEISRR